MNLTTNSTDKESPTPRDGTEFLISGSFLAVLCPFTVLANALLLVAIYKDPFKTFRCPTACFLVGLSITDLVTGLVPEPMVTVCYFMMYNHHPKQAHCLKVFEIAGIVAAITTNASFFIVMAFSIAQYIVVAFLLKYKGSITIRKTVVVVAIIFLYATLFEMARFIGVPKEVLEKIDLHLHSTFSLLFTIIIYVLLQRSFCKQMVERSAWMESSTKVNVKLSKEKCDASQEQKQKRQLKIERKFVRLNLLLILILLVCSQPSAILWYVYLYAGESTKKSQMLFYVRVIAENTLYLKFLLDPFVFAWRITKYREALRKVLQGAEMDKKTAKKHHVETLRK